jgi:ribonuclease I
LHQLSPTASAELPTSWPDLLGNDLGFWRRQWSEHGTCSYTTFNQTQYFDKANDIWKQLNLFDTLKAQGISPSTSSKTHLRADFENAISKHLGFTLKVQFHCPSNELLEIRLCRNRAGNQYVNCTRTGNCGTSFNWIP